jgi:putative FmdB family regulatory protein
MSKLILFEFQCPCCDLLFDDLVHPDVKTHVCPECQSPHAKRVLSAPHFDIRMGLDPTGNPTMAAKWARQHEQARKVEKQRERDHGPGVWGAEGADIRR